eukprot:8142115-Pyramimonas_sp.AAC.1
MALRTGQGRIDFLEQLEADLNNLNPTWFRDHGSPDEIFELLESALSNAGKEIFTTENTKAAEY